MVSRKLSLSRSTRHDPRFRFTSPTLKLWWLWWMAPDIVHNSLLSGFNFSPKFTFRLCITIITQELNHSPPPLSSDDTKEILSFSNFFLNFLKRIIVWNDFDTTPPPIDSPLLTIILCIVLMIHIQCRKEYLSNNDFLMKDSRNFGHWTRHPIQSDYY